MRRKQSLTGIAAFTGMLILILDSKTALEGARSGLDLCLKTVLPSLFPFFLLSILLTSSLSGFFLSIFQPIRQLCGLGKGTESILLSGFLGGYPVGAQAVACAYSAGQLSRQEAQRMLAFCSNAGPAFLFGMVASMFPERWMAWALWGVHILSALLTARSIPGSVGDIGLDKKCPMGISQAMLSAVRVMASVCGWVLVFRVVIAFLGRWVLWLLPMEAQVSIAGLLELSNGCCLLPKIPDIAMRFLICSAMLSLGGACVAMQTAAVTEGLSLRWYFLGKGLQTGYSLLLSFLLLWKGWGVTLGIAGILLLLPGKKQKRSSIQQLLGV